MNRLNSKMERTKKRISELEDRITEINQSEQQREDRPEKNKDLKNFNKRPNILVIRILEGREKYGMP